MTHHQVFMAAPAINVPFDPSGIMFVILFVWSHWGLWIYLTEEGGAVGQAFSLRLSPAPQPG